MTRLTAVVIFILGLAFTFAVVMSITEGRMPFWMGVYVIISYFATMIIYNAISKKDK